MPEFEGALTTEESTELYKLCDVAIMLGERRTAGI